MIEIDEEKNPLWKPGTYPHDSYPELCRCGHTREEREDHSKGASARFAHLMLPGCCRVCWSLPLEGCRSFRPPFLPRK